MMRETKVAIEAAKEAGKIAMRYYGKKISATIKADGSPVTEADKLCEKAIISIVRHNFPEHSILGEESGSLKGNNHKWIIDPIDGTKDFMRGAPFFANMIGMEKNGKVVAGVIFLPALNKLFYAEKNGAYLNGKRVHVSKTDELEQAHILYGNLKGLHKNNRIASLLKLSQHAMSIRSFPAPYGYSLVAEGIADATIEPAVHPWDLAAIKIIAEEAGGKLTNFSGADTIYSGNAIISNKRIHTKLLEMVK